MTITMDLSESAVATLRALSEPDRLQFAGDAPHKEAERRREIERTLAAMTPARRREFEEVCVVIQEAIEQIEAGEEGIPIDGWLAARKAEREERREARRLAGETP